MGTFNAPLICKAEWYRRYAAELRAIADISREKDNQALMDVADSFDRMAHATEDMSRAKTLLAKRATNERSH